MNDDTTNATAQMPTLVAELLSKLKPADPQAYREHVLKTEIFPTIERWGFERRFHRELNAMHDKQKRAYDRLCERMNGKGAVVALVGERGLGKTSIAAQFAIRTAWKNRDEALKAEGRPLIEHVIYRKCARIIARFKPLFADFGSTETSSLMDSLDYLCRHQEYLVIDEVHDCDDLKMKSRVITDLIDRRYSACRDTVLIANQTAKDFAASIGDSVISRLNEHGIILECHWPSYRVQ